MLSVVKITVRSIAVLSLFVGSSVVNAQCSGGQCINQLGSASTLTGTELIPIFQSSNPAVSMTLNAAKSFINGMGAGVSSINAFGGDFFIGGGLSVNELFVGTNPPGPWDPYVPLTSNVVFQTTGTTNALRNGSMTSLQHYKFMTQDQRATFPYRFSVASFTGVMSGTTTLTVSGLTGVLQPFQRVTDAVNFTTNGATAVGNDTLHFASTTGIVAGMHVTNLTHPRSIAGNIRVASTTGTTVVLTHEAGFTGNAQMLTTPGVSSGDTIAFGTLPRGTYIVRQLTGSTGSTGTYELNNAVTVGSETMSSAGGWAAEGIYIVPVGTAGTGNYVECLAFGGTFNGSLSAPNSIQCFTTGSLDDIVIRFPIDYIDASRIQCGVYTGDFRNCISSNNFIQPVTFQINLTYSNDVITQPTLVTKNPCPLIATSQAGANGCLDDWTNASYDLEPVTMPACDSMTAPTPIGCTWGYSWTPTGISGGYQVEFHTNAFTDTQSFIIGGFELKQTPGVTCLGSVPPCFQYVTGPIEMPDVVADMQRNMRFAQLIGSGWENGWNAGNAGAIETVIGFTYSTTQFIASWPLQVQLRCDVWTNSSKGAPTCAPPYVYFNNIGDYKFTNASGEFAATDIAVFKKGMNSIAFLATSSGMTANQPGIVTWGTGIGDMILIDSSIIGD